MTKLILLTTYFVITPALLVFCIIFFSFLSFHNTSKRNSFSLFSQQENKVAYAALPSTQNVFDSTIEAADARTELVRQFFEKYGSPLEPYAEEVVLTADEYGLDFRLLPAIGMQESNLCRRAPIDSYNCWGFGIYGSKVTRFGSYSEAIQTVTKTLAQKYRDDGLHSPEEIMTRYTPSSNGSWARSVIHFMEQLQ